MIITLILPVLFSLGLGASGDEKPALITGTVHSASDKSPLIEYSLELRAEGRLEHVTTNAAGQFSSALRYPPGRITLIPFDSESTNSTPLLGGLPQQSAATGPLEFEWNGKPLAVTVACGPTFSPTWKEPDGAPVPPAPLASIARLIAVTPGAIDEGVALETRLRISADGRVWVRFGALPRGFFKETTGARFEVVTLDGSWHSARDLDAVALAKAGSVQLTWRPAGMISGTVRDEADKQIPNAWITLERLSETDGTVLERRRVCAAYDGSFGAPGLELGRWQLSGRPLRHHPFTSEIVNLKATPHTQLDISLLFEGRRTQLTGRATAGALVAGRPAPPTARVMLRRAEEGLPEDVVTLAWQVESGSWVAPVTFDELPTRRYELGLEPAAGDEMNWEKLTLSAEPGADPVTFRRR